MKSIKVTACRRLAGLLTLLGALALATPAHAQFGGFGGFQQQQPIGTTLAVPLQGRAFADLVLANAFRQRNVSVVAVTGTALGNFNSLIAVVGVTQRNSFGQTAPAQTMFVPTYLLPTVRQINLNRVEVNQVSVGNGNAQVAEVSVDQGNAATLPKSGYRYFFAPAGAVGSLFQLNANIVIVNQIAIGDGNNQIALVGVSQQNSGGVQVGSQWANSLVQINANVTVVNQIATGNGNNQVAVVNVGQQNG